ncbi:MAG: hypothetical protein WAK12_11155 [Acidimicrobiales bacterium]
MLCALIALSTAAVVFATALPAYASSSPGPSDAQRLALAQHELASLFSAAPLPAGSRQITAAVAEETKPFSGDKSSVYGGNEVGATKFFVAPSANSSLTWLRSQPLSGHAPSGVGASGTTHTQLYLLSGTAVLEQPEVVYIASTRPNGTLEFSVTAMVWWRSQKPALAIVPSGSTKLIVKLNRGLNVKKTDRKSSVTSDDKSLIASVIAHINALPVPSPLPTNCPVDVGASLTMSFYRGSSAKPYAVVVADPGGCGPVTISNYNAYHARTSASDVAGGVALSKFVAAQLGLTNLTPT